MNTFEVTYDGKLRTTAIHLDSGNSISTDAPKDNHGLGESFSPTDLVCTSLASCILTIMAIAVEKKGINIKGTSIQVKKIMKDNPRMIESIDVMIHFQESYDKKIKIILERSALNCPVHRSLSEKIEKNIKFIYP
ncbi:MAG: osmotically inducible protein OsmC [Crocinitomicaceae bacterium]|nr:osmotically inducible protein OsmC [Crocinitomicaceae bacterium]|tara:strand:- start:4710 stop:5114 length:405 start_codon:yes stop_codon:yes gene_type:complete